MAHALDLVGERWALLVVRELMLGPKRYSDLLADLPGISTNVLASRLEQLESVGVVQRRRLPAPAASTVYELTDWGSELEPVICSIGRWGARSPLHDATAQLSSSAFVLSLRTNFDRKAARRQRCAIELRLGDDVFIARIVDGEFSIERADATAPDVTVTALPTVLAAVVYGGLPVATAVDAGDAEVAGDVAVAQRFFASFRLPERAAIREA